MQNRSQVELNSGVSALDARSREEEYFRAHPVWRQCQNTVRGVTALTDKLTGLLVQKIQLQLGPMRREVSYRYAIHTAVQICTFRSNECYMRREHN
jgi:hypothetical protein